MFWLILLLSIGIHINCSLLCHTGLVFLIPFFCTDHSSFDSVVWKLGLIFHIPIVAIILLRILDFLDEFCINSICLFKFQTWYPKLLDRSCFLTIRSISSIILIYYIFFLFLWFNPLSFTKGLSQAFFFGMKFGLFYLNFHDPHILLFATYVLLLGIISLPRTLNFKQLFFQHIPFFHYFTVLLIEFLG